MLSTHTFKARVEKLCNQQGLSIWEVSKLAGHQRNWLYERMQGETVRMTTIRAVAKVFKVTPAFFLTKPNSKTH